MSVVPACGANVFNGRLKMGEECVKAIKAKEKDSGIKAEKSCKIQNDAKISAGKGSC